MAGGCTLAALGLSRLFHQAISADTLFIMGTILAGYPILFHELQGIRYHTIGIEALVSLAVIGALCIGELSETAIVTFLFQFGSYLESKTIKKTRCQ